jgi:hypothetical protein
MVGQESHAYGKRLLSMKAQNWIVIAWSARYKCSLAFINDTMTGSIKSPTEDMAHILHPTLMLLVLGSSWASGVAALCLQLSDGRCSARTHLIAHVLEKAETIRAMASV